MNDQIIRLLLIEDNPSDALLLEETLAQVTTAQFRLINVERLAEGLERLRQELFDVVLLDLGLPDSQAAAANSRGSYPRADRPGR